jgi:hypothetical protein
MDASLLYFVRQEEDDEVAARRIQICVTGRREGSN